MDKAWERLLQIVRAAEGGGTSTETVADSGKKPNGRAAEDDDDEDEGVRTKTPDERWEGYAKEIRKESERYRRQRTEAREDTKRARSEIAAKDAEIARLKTDHLTAIEAARTEAKVAGERAVGEAKSAADQRFIRTEVKLALQAAGCANVEDGLKLVDVSAIKIADTGDVSGAVEAIAALKDKSPYLFGSKASSTSSTAKAPAAKTGDAKHAKDMSDEEFNAEMAKMGVRLR